jgi:hypothetical protein
VGRISGKLLAVQVVDVPPTVHPVGAKGAAQLWIGVVDASRATEAWREARGIPRHRLGVGRCIRCATVLLRGVALDDPLFGGGLITEIGRTGRRWIVGAQRI